MLNERIAEIFRESLRSCQTKKKYDGIFNQSDENRIVSTFEMALENESVTETLLCDILMEEKNR